MTILPQPKRLKKLGGTVSVARFGIVMSMNCDSRIFKAVQKLADEMYCETGIYPRINKSLCPKAEGNIVIDCASKKSEGYKLSATASGIKITGDSLAGAFYGIQTLRQMLESCGEDIECCEISDSPDMKYRGFYHDASRGRVPTVDGCKKLIDFLAYYKHNSYQLYIEHTFDFDEYKGIYKAFGYMTPEEIMEIDDYCYENFIDFVPSLSTFGHLFRILESKKYKNLCELDSYTPRNNPWANSMAHHTIDACNPESIKLICSIIDQYVPLFRSKYFNICCDETFDLCNGKNVGKDKGELYLEFTMKIIDHLKSLGKTVMMWGDVVLHHPETMSRFPDDMIMLNWNYADKPPVENIAKFAEQRFSQVVCPGTSCWNQFVEVIGYAEQNISAMVGNGGAHKVFGMLNTSWGDYGSMCPMTCTLYGIVLGGVLSWNHKTKVMCEKYDKAVSESVYGDPTGETVKLIRAIGECEMVLSWGSFINRITGDNFYYGVDDNALPQTGEPYNANADRCFEIAEKLRRLPTQSDIINDLRVQAEGLGHVNRMMARWLDKIEEPEDGEIEDWCERYAESWLRDDKLSELEFVLAKMRGKNFDTKALLSRD